MFSFYLQKCSPPIFLQHVVELLPSMRLCDGTEIVASQRWRFHRNVHYWGNPLQHSPLQSWHFDTAHRYPLTSCLRSHYSYLHYGLILSLKRKGGNVKNSRTNTASESKQREVAKYGKEGKFDNMLEEGRKETVLTTGPSFSLDNPDSRNRLKRSARCGLYCVSWVPPLHWVALVLDYWPATQSMTRNHFDQFLYRSKQLSIVEKWLIALNKRIFATNSF